MKRLTKKYLQELFRIIDKRGGGSSDAKKLLAKVFENEGRYICLEPGKEPGYQVLLRLHLIERDKGGGLHLTKHACDVINYCHNLGLEPTYQNKILILVDFDGHFRSCFSSSERGIIRNWARAAPPEEISETYDILCQLEGSDLKAHVHAAIPNFVQ